ncbi:hypothetical protein KCP78_02810 [Salmonella enterica subsp. enterica]|nr:hypothetical protein KCP78_02810 [Salmonella enterica subsp. enterica]
MRQQRRWLASLASVPSTAAALSSAHTTPIFMQVLCLRRANRFAAKAKRKGRKAMAATAYLMVSMINLSCYSALWDDVPSM